VELRSGIEQPGTVTQELVAAADEAVPQEP
jgi:hypothetical protein